MNAVALHRFEELKKKLLIAAGLKNILPSDCRGLSDAVLKKTNRRISETTLKRVYGFAHSKFNPSLFTIDAMAQYCDYKSWADFCEQQESVPRNNSPTSIGWNSLKQNANKVTSYTLQALKNRAGIPYNHTIQRQFFNDHIDAFLQDNYTATAFIAPSGYGKSIALCHWIDEQFELSFTQDKNDIHLCFSGSALANNAAGGRPLNEWMLSLLGYDGESDLISLLDDTQEREGDFFLIIDNFDEYFFKPADYQLLLNEVVDIISLYKGHPWFKVILTMRSATWISNKHIIINGDSNWFPGFFNDESRSVNVPLFDAEEINKLCTNLYAENKPAINLETAQILSNPLFFQFYYQSHPDDFCEGKIDQVSIHELISTYILNKIYLGVHAAEKQLLIEGLVENIEVAKRYIINKVKVVELLKRYPQAYHDMLSVGYLKELNTSEGLKFENYIEFGNVNYLSHAVAQVMLSNNDGQFDERLIIMLNNIFPRTSHKLVVLKWAIMFAVKNGQYNNLRYLNLSEQSATEKADLIIFIRGLFEKELAKGSAITEQLFAQDSPNDLFDYFFGIEFINVEYQQSLKTLLKFKLSNNRKISVYTSLAVIAIIQMDILKLEEVLDKLKEFSVDEFDKFPINPLNSLETIYTYLKHGIIKTEAFAELTRFYFNPPTAGIATKSSSANDVIYLLAIYTLSININHHKTLRFINAVEKVYKKPAGYRHGYSFLLKVMTVESMLALSQIENALILYDEILLQFEDSKNVYTPFMKTLFYLLKVKVAIHTEPKPDVLAMMKPLIHLADESGYKLIKIHSLVLILANHKLLQEDVNYYKKTYYDFVRIVRESGFRSESFIKQEELSNQLRG